MNRLARALGKASVYVRDAQAVRRGRITERVGNRVIGGLMSRAMRGRWF